MTTCENCTQGSHIDCDGTVPAGIWFDPCPCDCNPYWGTKSGLVERAENILEISADQKLAYGEN